MIGRVTHTDDVPLTFRAEKEQQFTQVVHEASDLAIILC
jgi:hypothetical protein